MTLYHNTIRVSFAQHKLLGNLTFYQINKIINEIQIKELKEREYRQIGMELWVVIKGKIIGGDGTVWEDLDCVNVHELLTDPLEEIEEVSCERAVVAYISREKLENCLGNTLERRIYCNEIQ